MAVAADADRDDDAARSALAWYDLGEVLSLDRLPAGGWFLQEFLAGELELEPSGAQVRAVMRAAGSLHVALGRLAVGYEPDRDSVFVQVTDPGFLISELPGLLRHYGLVTGPAGTAIACLAGHQGALGALPRQLVHGDIGPDNVLLDGEQVVAIIDFTPHVLPVLFAASTALYWYHVYGQPAVRAASLAVSRAAMARARPWPAAEQELWAAGLVWEGPAQARHHAGTGQAPWRRPRARCRSAPGRGRGHHHPLAWPAHIPYLEMTVRYDADGQPT